MQGRRRRKLMQRAAGQPAAENSVDRSSDRDDPHLAGEAVMAAWAEAEDEPNPKYVAPEEES